MLFAGNGGSIINIGAVVSCEFRRHSDAVIYLASDLSRAVRTMQLTADVGARMSKCT
jgi:hypothetical protein